MADSSDTTNPSRRLFLAAGPAAAVFGSLHAAAQDAPPDDEHRDFLLQSYLTWLNLELANLDREIGSEGAFRVDNAGWDYFWRGDGETPTAAPSTRAEAVLAAVGCDWRGDWRLTKGGAHV